MQPPLWEQMWTFFWSAFRFEGLQWPLAMAGIALALAFGAIWLVMYRPALHKWIALLAVAGASALLTWTAIAFIQIPLQGWWNEAIISIWGVPTVMNWLLVAGIPAVLISGLVQEGAKLVPIAAYRARNPRSFDARTGLLVGAVAGAGFGIFEAIWVHNTVFAAGVPSLASDAFAALYPFAERFFAVGFHVALSALVGYGLATRRGWQFYLLAAGLHGLGNYAVVLAQAGVVGSVGVLLYIGVLTVASTVVAVSIRRNNTRDQVAGRAPAHGPA